MPHSSFLRWRLRALPSHSSGIATVFIASLVQILRLSLRTLLHLVLSVMAHTRRAR
jgi:hypothetical protein